MNDQNELDNVTSTESENEVNTGNDVSRLDFSKDDSSSLKPPMNFKKGFWIVLIILIITIGGVVYYLGNSSTKNKQNNKETVESTTYSLNKEDEKKISEIVPEITNFYEDNKRTKLKQNIDTSKLKSLKKNIDSVSDETLKKEFLRLYEKLQSDIKSSSTTVTSSSKSS